MISKLLLTLLVIGLVIVYLRKQHRSRRSHAARQNSGRAAGSDMPVRASDRGELEQFLNQARRSPDAGSTSSYTQADALAPRIKVILWSLMAILLLAGAIGSYLHWQDQQRLVTVLLHRDATTPPVIYRVAKRNLGANGFTTNDGTQVTVSANERMEVIGL
ncbi:MAG: hypothetical protein Q7W55_16665 [Pseudohongiella sp.]|nr:hypothetical protein [Pseudohongiella sp.]MDO9520206.1 hypothetical protein [Pseudohongiella sp.]